MRKFGQRFRVYERIGFFVDGNRAELPRRFLIGSREGGDSDRASASALKGSLDGGASDSTSAMGRLIYRLFQRL